MDAQPPSERVTACVWTRLFWAWLVFRTAAWFGLVVLSGAGRAFKQEDVRLSRAVREGGGAFVALHAASTVRFPGGVLFAVHDDKSVTAFDLRDVARVLQLPSTCVQ